MPSIVIVRSSAEVEEPYDALRASLESLGYDVSVQDRLREGLGHEVLGVAIHVAEFVDAADAIGRVVERVRQWVNDRGRSQNEVTEPVSICGPHDEMLGAVSRNELPEPERGRYDGYHDVFEAIGRDASLWRYMNFAKFVSLLESRALHFARVDVLEDEFEGSLSIPMSVLPRIGIDQHGQQVEIGPWSESFDAQMRAARETLRHCIWVNCWNRSETESAALWDLYARRDQGIAVRTTFGRLVSSFGDARLPPAQRPAPPTVPHSKHCCDDRLSLGCEPLSVCATSRKSAPGSPISV
jgi:hypothetical protein